MDKSAALGRVRVVDFTHMGVGPLTCRFLADMGAEVIKVETASRVDGIRAGFPFKQGKVDLEGAAPFASYNVNKLDITLNLKHPRAIELAKQLVKVSDVVADSFTPGVLDRLGLGYEELRKVRPDIIQIGMSFAGRNGPYAQYRGHGMQLQALVGLPHLTGYPERPPMAPGMAYSDWYCPQVWFLAVTAALFYRNKTGKGQFIDGSDLEAALDLVDTALLDWQANGHLQTRRGNRDSSAAPHNIYRCKGEDRWVAIAAFSDEEWQALKCAMGEPLWSSDQRFATLLGRQMHEGELDRLIGQWTAERNAEQVMVELQRAGVPAGVVQNAEDLWSDPQLRHRGHFWEPEDPEQRWFTYEPAAYRLSKTPPRFYRRFPHLGEHTQSIFTDLLGLSDDEFARAVGEGAIA